MTWGGMAFGCGPRECTVGREEGQESKHEEEAGQENPNTI